MNIRKSRSRNLAPARFRKIYIDRELAGERIVRRFLERFGGKGIEWIDGKGDLGGFRAQPGDPVANGKRALYLTRHRGEFLKPCPGSPGQVCCGYQVLNLLNNCPFDCTYCILQSYLDFQPITLFVNVEEALEETRTKAQRQPDRLLRVGTGELGDSLALEPWFPLNRELVAALRDLDNVYLELKTKSARVDGLLGIDHGGKVIVSWSLCPDRVMAMEEPGAASVRRRLGAARRVEAEGYLLGFHFDPIIRYSGWEEEYRQLLDALFSTVGSDSICWVSLGAFRFPPRLGEIAVDRALRTKIYLDEFVPCPDGKMRYSRPIREEIYGKMREWLEERAPSVEVYLCMESSLVWENVFGLKPAGEEWLSDRLDRALRGKADRPVR